MDREALELHGHRTSYLRAGDGEQVVLLVHGITGYAEQWARTIPRLAEHGLTVIAPDLVGHGQSAKPRGDYSLGAYAAGLRDLVVALGHDRVTVVGHSLGGGVAMQFAYQFPERTERLALVSSGGLGREVSLLLRAATLPGAGLVLPLLTSGPTRRAGRVVRGALHRTRLMGAADLAEIGDGFASLRDGEARAAFLHTLRGVIDPLGQRVSAVDRLYLAEAMPSLVVWGDRDPVIPPRHALVAHDAMPGSRLVMLDAGHFPQLEQPDRFTETLAAFVAETEPARTDATVLREQVLRHAGAGG